MSSRVFTSYLGYVLAVTAQSIEVYDKGVVVATVASMSAARAVVKRLRREAREEATA